MKRLVPLIILFELILAAYGFWRFPLRTRLVKTYNYPPQVYSANDNAGNYLRITVYQSCTWEEPQYGKRDIAGNGEQLRTVRQDKGKP